MNTESGKPAIAIYFDPPSHHFLKNKLFDIDAAKFGGDDLMAPYRYVREFFQKLGIPVQTADLLPPKPNGTKNVYISFGILENYQRLAKERPDTVLSAYFALECPIVEPRMYRKLGNAQYYFKRIFSWSDSETLKPFVGAPLRCQPFRWMQSFDDVHQELWQETNRKFLVMINANKLPRVYWQELYTERMRAVEYFSQHHEIDLYGKGWEAPSIRMGKTWVPYTFKALGHTLRTKWQRFRPDPLLVAARKAYRGVAESKSRTLGAYKFALCFENSILKGWITEKIFDCFFAGTVPIYWGEPEIEKHMPENCYIDMRRFHSYEELRTFLHSLSEDDIQEYKQNARAFLRSPAFYPFSRAAFSEVIRNIVSEDTGVAIESSGIGDPN